MKVSTIIVDDEPLARKRISGLLADIDDIDVVAQCKNGAEAIQAIHAHQPDLVFLDIQMPGVDGFGVLDRLQKLPCIIFVTAYDQYALHAFDYHAIDYLLKPYKDARFHEALGHALNQIQLQNLTSMHHKLESLRASARHPVIEHKGVEFELKQQGRIIKINSNNINWLSGAGNYLELHSDSDTFLLRNTISSVEYDLQQNGFIRIHRSILVNTASIKRVNYLNTNNQYKFVLKDDTELQSARSYKDRVISYLGSN